MYTCKRRRNAVYLFCAGHKLNINCSETTWLSSDIISKNAKCENKHTGHVFGPTWCWENKIYWTVKQNASPLKWQNTNVFALKVNDCHIIWIQNRSKWMEVVWKTGAVCLCTGVCCCSGKIRHRRNETMKDTLSSKKPHSSRPCEQSMCTGIRSTYFIWMTFWLKLCQLTSRSWAIATGLLVVVSLKHFATHLSSFFCLRKTWLGTFNLSFCVVSLHTWPEQPC